MTTQIRANEIQNTDDLYLASFAHYAGARIEQVEITRHGRTIFRIVCPNEDWKAILAQYDNLRPYATSVRTVADLVRREKYPCQTGLARVRHLVAAPVSAVDVGKV